VPYAEDQGRNRQYYTSHRRPTQNYLKETHRCHSQWDEQARYLIESMAAHYQGV
jgi:hypothetical protein